VRGSFWLVGRWQLRNAMAAMQASSADSGCRVAAHRARKDKVIARDGKFVTVTQVGVGGELNCESADVDCPCMSRSVNALGMHF
jgi:hypothetical protein